jgi:hypothetical protein
MPRRRQMTTTCLSFVSLYIAIAAAFAIFTDAKFLASLSSMVSSAA